MHPAGANGGSPAKISALEATASSAGGPAAGARDERPAAEPAGFRGRRANPAVAASGLYQRALISPGLPIRGVTTPSPTFASIQVSGTSGSPAASSPSAGSSLIP